jgi:GNAT superfamily N-acetyltransferase
MTVALHRDALASAMGLPVTTFAYPGTTVVPGEDRRGERLASHYKVDAHSVIWVDPDIEAEFTEWHGTGLATTFDQLRAWAVAERSTVLGAGYEHVLPGPFVGPPRAAEIAVLDGTSASTIKLVRAMQSECSEDDNDEAEFDLEALDEHLIGWIENGALLALAGGRPFDVRPGFLDVGVLVHPNARRRGLGRSVIAAVTEEVLAAGRDPLYRCNVDNEGSWRLCRGLGFEPVLELEAFHWRALSA